MRTYSKSLNIDSQVKPAFSVHKNTANQSITTKEIVTWPTEEFDTNSNFASNRFTPTVAGKYFLSAHVLVDGLTAGNSLVLYIYKNGSEYKDGQDVSSSTYHGVSVNAVVDANGTTDYFEIWFEYGTTGSTTIYGTVAKTYWTGCKVD